MVQYGFSSHSFESTSTGWESITSLVLPATRFCATSSSGVNTCHKYLRPLPNRVWLGWRLQASWLPFGGRDLQGDSETTGLESGLCALGWAGGEMLRLSPSDRLCLMRCLRRTSVNLSFVSRAKMGFLSETVELSSCPGRRFGCDGMSRAKAAL